MVVRIALVAAEHAVTIDGSAILKDVIQPSVSGRAYLI
jgi:hypothetical protein